MMDCQLWGVPADPSLKHQTPFLFPFLFVTVSLYISISYLFLVLLLLLSRQNGSCGWTSHSAWSRCSAGELFRPCWSGWSLSGGCQERGLTGRQVPWFLCVSFSLVQNINRNSRVFLCWVARGSAAGVVLALLPAKVQKTLPGGPSCLLLIFPHHALFLFFFCLLIVHMRMNSALCLALIIGEILALCLKLGEIKLKCSCMMKTSLSLKTWFSFSLT